MSGTVISKDTLMPVSFVVTLVAGLFWMSSKEMENWSLKLKMANPDIDIPEVK
jgi:hypothetical protein